MLWILVVVFFVLWILGLTSVYSSLALTWLFFVLFAICLITMFVRGRSQHYQPPTV